MISPIKNKRAVKRNVYRDEEGGLRETRGGRDRKTKKR